MSHASMLRRLRALSSPALEQVERASLRVHEVPIGLCDRLEVTTGACPAFALQGIDLEFEQGAWAPAQNWRPFEQDDLGLIGPASRDMPAWSRVDVTRVPPSVVEQLLAINERILARRSRGIREFTLDENSLVEEIDLALTRWSGISNFGPTLGMVLGEQRGGTYLATSQTRDGRVKTGVHIDSWDHKAFGRRRGCTNRISINIGKYPRHLVFCPDLVTDINQQFRAQAQPPKGGADILSWYFNVNPAVTFLRLRIEPGEAYIAPTENLIHDGSNLLVQGLDRQLVIRGFFRFDPESPNVSG